MEVWRRFWKIRRVADSHTFQTGAGLLQTGTVNKLKSYTFINKDSKRAGMAAKLAFLKPFLGFFKAAQWEDNRLFSKKKKKKKPSKGVQLEILNCSRLKMWYIV